jgi:glycosyltransferase involved in cell wall biosynthesis
MLGTEEEYMTIEPATSRARPKICILTTLHRPDDDRIFYKECLSLRQKFDDIVLIAPAETDVPNFRMSGIHLIALGRKRGGVGRILLLIQALFIVRRIKPTICHFHDYDQLFIVPFLCIGRKTSLVYDCHEAYPEIVLNMKQFPLWCRRLGAALVNSFELLMAARCDLVITADDATRAKFVSRQIKSVTIFNFPRLSLFNDAVRQRDNIIPEQAEDVLIYHGSMSEERGLFTLLHALAVVKKSLPGCVLLLIGLGPGKLKDKTLQIIDQLTLRQNVEIIEFVPHSEIGSYLRKAKIGVIPFCDVPKLRMNIPIKLFEYMSCGIPVIASKLPAYATFVETATSGYLVPPGAVNDMACKIVALLRDENTRVRMGENGRRFVMDRWNWENMECFLMENYDAIISPGLIDDLGS